MLRQGYVLFSDSLFPVVIGYSIFTCYIFRELFCLFGDWIQVGTISMGCFKSVHNVLS